MAAQGRRQALLAMGCLLTLVVGALPNVSAQEAAPSVLEDPSGDVQIGAASSTPIPPGVLDNVDVRSLQVVESPTTFEFDVIVQSLDPPSPLPHGELDGTHVAFGFRHQTAEFRLVTAFPGNGPLAGTAAESRPSGELQRRPVGGSAWDPVNPLSNLTLDASLPGFKVIVTKELLTDQDGTPPLAGRVLDQFWVMASDTFTNVGIVSSVSVSTVSNVTDRMPNTGLGGTYLVKLGIPQSGTAQLGSLRPTRASNGEETSYLFQVNITNSDSKAHTYGLSMERVPSSWNVTLPVPAVSLPAGGKTTLTVVVGTPFAHIHGGRQNLNLVAQDVDKPGDHSSLTLSIIFLTVPQPAGHHSEVVLHTRGADSVPAGPLARGEGVQLYMNTLEDDASDIRAPSGPETSSVVTTDQFRWCARLEPTLSLGIHLNQAIQGLASIPITAPAPLSGTLNGSLVLVDPVVGKDFGGDTCFGNRPHTTIATIAATQADASQSPVVKIPIVPSAGPDVFPYVDGRDLFLDLRFTPSRPVTNADTPTIAPGGNMILPLLEYHDPIQSLASNGPQLMVIGNASVLRNPGHVALAKVHLDAATDSEYSLTLAGTHADWGRIIGGPLSKSKPDAYVAVTVPEHEGPSSIANLLIEGHDTNNPLHVLYARFVVEVDTRGTQPDDAGQLATIEPKAKVSPMMGPLAAAIALVAVAGLQRRRRQR